MSLTHLPEPTSPSRRRGGGPRTPEGKERSRRNALKHGLTGAGVVLPEDLDEEFRRRAEQLADTLRPADEVERKLVERAALADVRLQRCREAETAQVAARVRAAEREWEQKRAEEVLGHARQLDTEPDLAKLRLEATAEGCDWLIAQWRQLDEQLSRHGNWSRAATLRATRLLGLPGLPTVRSAEPVASLVLAALALWADRLGDGTHDLWQDDLDTRDAGPDPFAGFLGGTFARMGAVTRWSFMRPSSPTSPRRGRPWPIASPPSGNGSNAVATPFLNRSTAPTATRPPFAPSPMARSRPRAAYATSRPPGASGDRPSPTWRVGVVSRIEPTYRNTATPSLETFRKTRFPASPTGPSRKRRSRSPA